MTSATVYVSYDPSTKTITLTGGQGADPDGDVTVDYGDGNTINFDGRNQDTSKWTLNDLSWTPENSSPDPSTFSKSVSNTCIVLTDNDKLPAGQPDKTYKYRVAVYDVASRSIIWTDPKIINKPAPAK